MNGNNPDKINPSVMSRRKFLQTSVAAGSLLGMGVTPSLSSLQAKVKGARSFDLLIKNGVVYTGDGRAPIQGDIGIKDGKIAAVGHLGDTANQVVEVDGYAVSPGFIDIHSHTDTHLLLCREGDSKIYQGVTTDVGGNCGGSPFPYSDQWLAAHQDDQRLIDPTWSNIDGFYQALEENKIGINYASFTGHGQLRSMVVGDYDVKATPEQIKAMQTLLAQQLEMGSVGLTCGMIYTPGCYASNEEITELCKVVAQYNRLFAIHIRNESSGVEEALQETIEFARPSGVRLQISHLKASRRVNWHKLPHLLQMIDAAAYSGMDIAFDRYPYTASSTGLSTTFIPQRYLQGSKEEIVAILKDPQKREELTRYIHSRLDILGGPQYVLISSTHKPENEEFKGKELGVCATMMDMEVPEFILHLLVSENVRVSIIVFSMDEENLKLIYAHRLGMPGSDGSVYSPQGPLSVNMPHPRSYGTFPRFLGSYVREQKVIDLPTAIYKMTALPASRLGLHDRGLIRPGYHADLVVFDPQTISELSSYANPHQFNKGIEHVFVNGVWTLKNANHTGALAGTVL